MKLGMKLGVLALASTAFLAGTAANAGMLDVIKERGELRCGVSQGVLGFSAPNDKGEWTGFDIDFAALWLPQRSAIPTR